MAQSVIGRVAYPNLSKARSRERSDGTKSKPRFSVTLVYPEGTDLSAMQAECEKVAKEKYKGKVPRKFNYPFREGSDRQKDDGSYPDGFCETDTFCEFWRYEDDGPVPCVDQLRNELLPSDVYAGMQGRTAYHAFCYDVDGNKGVALWLDGFQKASDGERIGTGGPIDPQKAFDDLPVEEDETPF